MLLQTIGEKEFLNKIGKKLYNTEKFDWKDDCIIVPIGNNLNLLYSIDRPELIYNTGNHKLDVRLFGRWSAGLVANDIIACGASPKGIAFDIGIDELDQNEIENWIEGVEDVCRVYNMKYEGGNLGIGKGIVGMAYGFQKEIDTLRRKGANNGDILISTGDIGTGWAIRLWETFKNPTEIKKLKSFINYKHEPWIDIKVFEKIWDLKAINCAMDITDGIIEFGYEIYEHNNLGVIFECQSERPFPINFVSEKLSFPIDAFMFESGYDTPYAHGWSIKKDKIKKVINILEQYNHHFTFLGRVTDEVDGVFLLRNDDLIKLPRYWDDVYKKRGSIEIWKEEILPFFTNK